MVPFIFRHSVATPNHNLETREKEVQTSADVRGPWSGFGQEQMGNEDMVYGKADMGHTNGKKRERESCSES